VTRHSLLRNSTDGRAAPFFGFTLPTSNTTYCPNQFFDVCLPHHSRGVVRLVGYMIRKTLGWCDANGDPQQERFAISYNELEKEAGVSRSEIRKAIDAGVRAGFINCLRKPSPKTAGRTSVTGTYVLRWDHGDGYVKDPKVFDGFFAGEGNRTYIPNEFFDVCLRSETLAVVKVVGSVIRFSIGFQNQWGFRRQQTSLSYLDIQRYAKIRDPKTLASAIRSAVASNYLKIVETGYFDPNGGRTSCKATYAIRWLNDKVDAPIGQKNPAAQTLGKNQLEKPSGNGRKNPAADRFEIPSGIQITDTNKTLKQQSTAVIFEKLKAEGFDAHAAEAIARRYPAERIERQIRWLDQRRIKANRLGMLRAAIDQDWSDPALPGRRDTEKLGRPNFSRPSGLSFEEAIQRTKERLQD
jgi:hypothetical protein